MSRGATAHEVAVRGRWVAAAHCAVGTVLLTRPGGTAGRVGGKRRPLPPVWLVRVLGARSVLQGVATALAPQPSVLAGGAVADTTHALSMVPVMIASSRYRRVAAVSTVVAVATAAAGAAVAGTAWRTQIDDARRRQSG